MVSFEPSLHSASARALSSPIWDSSSTAAATTSPLTDSAHIRHPSPEICGATLDPTHWVGGEGGEQGRPAPESRDRPRAQQDRAPVPSCWTTRRLRRRAPRSSSGDRYGLFIGGDWRAEGDLRDDRPRRPRSRSPRSRRRLPRRSTSPSRRPRRIRERLVAGLAVGARQVPLPHRPHPAGALARVRRPRIAERRQADPRVPRRRPAARGGPLLLLRRLGRQARVRVPEPQAAASRRRRPDHPVELPAAHAGVEDRPRARSREHGRPQAGGDDAAVRAPLLRRPPAG